MAERYTIRASTHASKLTASAYKLIANGHEEIGEEILEVARSIRGMTVNGSLPPPSILRDTRRLFHALKVEAAIIGGIAVGVHARARGTEDIDFLARELPDPIKTRDHEFMRGYNFYPNVSRTGGHLVLDHHQGMIEILPAKTTTQKKALASAREEDVLGVRFDVVAPEYLIALKVEAISDNPSRMQKDRGDIVDVWEYADLSINKVLNAVPSEQRELLLQIIPELGE